VHSKTRSERALALTCRSFRNGPRTNLTRLRRLARELWYPAHTPGAADNGACGARAAYRTCQRWRHTT